MKLPEKSQFAFYDMMQKAKAPEQCWNRWQHYDATILLGIAKKLKQFGADPRAFIRGWDYFDTVADSEDYEALSELTDIEQTVLVGETYERHMRRNRDPYLTLAMKVRPDNQYEARVKQASSRLKEFYKANNLTPGRLVPDAIKFGNKEYRSLKNEYKQAFAELQAFNLKQRKARKSAIARTAPKRVAAEGNLTKQGKLSYD